MSADESLFDEETDSDSLGKRSPVSSSSRSAASSEDGSSGHSQQGKVMGQEKQQLGLEVKNGNPLDSVQLELPRQEAHGDRMRVSLTINLPRRHNGIHSNHIHSKKVLGPG
mmetsp:Transcript_40663/g.105566  ORF Transcript_40663/g.105566 Transcript_40663/m.105566 type:complete len:111 (+) Transcript_40663:167-499(+)